MEENDISGVIINTCYNIHVTMGPGLLESVYEEILCFELRDYGFQIDRQPGLPVTWKGIRMDIGFRPDIIVDRKVIVEIKSTENITPVHPKILLTYLRLTEIKLGFLVNFNVKLLKDGITRIVNNL